MLLEILTTKKQAGQTAIITAIFVLAIALFIALAIGHLILNQQQSRRNLVKSAQAYYTAESGIEDSIYRIKKSLNVPPNYTMTVGQGLVEVTVSSSSQNNRIITALSNVSDVFRKIETRLTIETINPEFFYGAQVGVLGLEMENNSRIEGAGGVSGNVYSNGPVDGDNGATITGNVFVATGMSQDQTHTVYNSDQTFGEANPIIDIAQSFKPDVSNTLVKASIYIKKVGDPGDRTVRILTDSSDSPSKTSLASATLRSDLVSASFGWVDIVFPSPSNLVQGNTYWLMIDASRNTNNYWVWGKDQNQGYGNGLAKYTQDWNAASPSWTTVAGDLNFKTFMGGQITFLNEVIVKGDTHANTITNSKICGSGFYQTIDEFSLNFLNNPSKPTCSDPLTPGIAHPGSSDPPLENMPISDSNINQWKQEAINGGTRSGDLIVDSNMSYGPQRIDGNLLMTSNNKTLTVTGTIYVTGYIDIDNGSAIRCAASYDLNSCVVVADKWVHISNNGIFGGSGQPGSYIMILSTSNCDGSFPINCTNHNAAMDLHNNAVGAIFYANDGLIFLHNGVEVSELTAKKIHLEPNAVVRYEQGLVNANFSSGPGGGWTVVGWKEIE
ncbi:MAG: pilus assembly PilX N-terminal domain-containing protein [Candidatus Portnoybacteria bacterium]|nr:pilus assembly PilX N-terminal domain-containing protein [Candidatus Portnoybacteria bacterium]